RPAHSQRGQREERAREAGEEGGDRQGHPEAPLRSHRQNRYYVRADRVEAHVAERDLPGEAKQHVQGDADDRGERERRHHEDVVAVRDRGERSRRGEERADREVRRELHTFFTAARPKRPFGIAASATMTRVNVTIWV